MSAWTDIRDQILGTTVTNADGTVTRKSLGLDVTVAPVRLDNVSLILLGAVILGAMIIGGFVTRRRG